MKKYLLFFLFLSLIGCFDPGFSSDEGISLTMVNRRENTYIGKHSLYIGAIKENKFYVTDSISSYDTIIPHVLDDNPLSYTGTDIKEIQGWEPEKTKISDISNKGAFLFVMSNGEQLFLLPFYFPSPNIGTKHIGISMQSTGLLFNDDISQDLEIVK